MELFKAHNQWATRPADERFWTVEEAAQASKRYADMAIEKTANYSDLRVEAREQDIVLIGRSGIPANLTHWSFGQVSERAGAPASYLRKLPATLAVQNLNFGLKARGLASKGTPNDDASLLFHQNGNVLLRAITGTGYARIWNYEVFERCAQLASRGWRTPPAYAAADGDKRARPATEADCLPGSSIVPGAMIAPAGLYASDHDMFAFMVNTDRPIETGSDGGAYRGFFAWNCEVGGVSLGVMQFLYQNVCGNHIVWGAHDVKEITLRHVGDRKKLWDKFLVSVNKLSDGAASDDEALIASARKLKLGANKDEVLDALFGIVRAKSIDLSQNILKAAVERAEQRTDRYGDPSTVWAVVNGLTELSQDTFWADERVKTDKAAGKLLKVTVF